MNLVLNLQFTNFVKIAPTFIKNSDKIILTEKQIKHFDFLDEQVIRGSIIIE